MMTLQVTQSAYKEAPRTPDMESMGSPSPYPTSTLGGGGGWSSAIVSYPSLKPGDAGFTFSCLPPSERGAQVL